MRSNLHKNQLTIVLAAFQVIFLVIFALYGKFHSSALPNNTPNDPNDVDAMHKVYPMFQDTHVMIFIGFGFLMTFLKRYGFSAVSINMLLAVFTIQWGIIVRGFSSSHNGLSFTISLKELLTADFAAAVILISMGAMLGKLSPTQYIIMAFLETPVALIVEHICAHNLKINDVGGSIVVHAFGAYFGLACAKGYGKKEQRGHQNEGSTYHTDIFAMIGAIFLWVYWPSFNAAVAGTDDARQRAVANTFLSLCSCTMTTFLVSQMVDQHKKFDMVHIANSTLAGGVAIGTTANVVLEPYHAMIVGVLAGLISVLGYKYLTPFLSEKMGIHDTCGVHNLHGMPGLLAGFASVAFLFIYQESQYSEQYGIIYPGMNRGADGERAITEKNQAVNQLLAILFVLLASISSGYITGLLLKLKMWDHVRDEEYYADGDYFETPGDYDFTSRIVTSVQKIEIAEYNALSQKEV